MGISNDNSVCILFVLERLTNRILHYRRALVGIMYYGRKAFYRGELHYNWVKPKTAIAVNPLVEMFTSKPL